MGIRKAIAEKLWKPPAKESLTPDTPTKVGKAVLCTYQSAGYSPTSTFSSQVKVFKKDSVVRESIVHSAMEIVGTGIFTSFNESYGLILQNKNAKQLIDWWNEQNNLDEKTLTVAIELAAYGNSFWKITPSGLQVIPIEAVSRATPYSNEKPVTEAYNLELTGAYKPNIIRFGEFIHFRVNVTSSSAPFGTGVISGLIETYDSDVPSLLETRNTIRTALKAGFAKFGNPNEIWSFEELGDDALDSVAKNVKDLPDTGGRISVNTKAAIVTPQSRRDTGWDSWISQMADEFIMSLGDPSLKASIESGFTEASIRGSIELFRKKILAFRRAIKRIVESMWSKVLQEYGFDPLQAQVKLNFGSEEIEWTIVDLIKAVETQIISKEEARAVLMKKARWELQGSAPKEDDKVE